MKKIILSILIICVLLIAVGCPGRADIEQDFGNPSDTEQPNAPTEPTSPTEPSQDKEITKMYITINGNKLEVTLAKNSSVAALVELLKQGDIAYTANDYGDFEKVGSIGHTLPRNDTQISTEAGDVILYQGNQLCLYYGNNSWNFTRIGKIEGYSASELRTLLGAGQGSVEITISLN